MTFDDSQTFVTSVNISHEIVHGLTFNPELTFIKWNDNFGRKARYDAANDNVQEGIRTSLKGESAFQGMLYLIRSF